MRLDINFRTPQQDYEDKTIAHKRSLLHWNELQEKFPELSVRCSLSTDDIGKTIIRAFINCPDGITDKDTRAAIHWMKNYFGNVERNFRKDQGTFYWLSKRPIKDENGDYEFMCFLEKTHPLTCEIVKVKKEVEVYESVCTKVVEEESQ